MHLNIFSKLAAIVPESLGFFGYMGDLVWKFLTSFLIVVFRGIYWILKWFLAVIDFMQYFIQKLIGLDYWMSSGDKTLDGATNSDLLFKFLYNETVQKVFRAMIGIFIVLLIVFTIFAIVKQEWKFATGTEQNNTKTTIIRSSLKSIMMVIIIPLIIILGVVSSNAILASIIKALSVDSTQSFANNIFYASSIGANKYRQYADGEYRKAVSTTVTFYIDEATGKQIVFSGLGSSDDLIENYSDYSDYLTAIKTAKKYTVDSVFKLVNPTRWGKEFYGYCISLNIGGKTKYYLVEVENDREEIDAMYYYLRNVLRADIMSSEDDIGNRDIQKDLGNKLLSERASTPCLIEGANIGDIGNETTQACYNTWEYASIFYSSVEFGNTIQSAKETNLTDYNLSGASANVFYNYYDYVSHFDGGQFGAVNLNAEYQVMADVIDFICKTGAQLYVVDITSPLLKWNYGGHEINTTFISEFDAAGKPKLYDNGANGKYLPFIVDYSDAAMSHEQGRTLYMAKDGDGNELTGSEFIMCWKVGNEFIPLVHKTSFTDPVTNHTYTFDSEYLSSSYHGVIIAKGTFDVDYSASNIFKGDPSYLKLGANLKNGENAIEFDNQPYYYNITKEKTLTQELETSATPVSDYLKTVTFDNSGFSNSQLVFDDTDEYLFRFMNVSTNEAIEFSEAMIDALVVDLQVEGTAEYLNINDGENYLFGTDKGNLIVVQKVDSKTLTVKGVNVSGSIVADNIVPVNKGGIGTIDCASFKYKAKVKYNSTVVYGDGGTPLEILPSSLIKPKTFNDDFLYEFEEKREVVLNGKTENIGFKFILKDSTPYTIKDYGGITKVGISAPSTEYSLQMYLIDLYDYMTGYVDSSIKEYTSSAATLGTPTILESYAFGIGEDEYNWSDESSEMSVYNGGAFVARLIKDKGLPLSQDELTEKTMALELNGQVVRFYNVKTQNKFNTDSEMSDFYNTLVKSMIIGCYKDRINTQFFTASIDLDFGEDWRFTIKLWQPEIEKDVLIDKTNGIFTLSKGIAFDYFFESVDIIMFYDLLSIGYWIIVFACVLMFKTLGNAIWGVIKRFYEITLYYLAIPVAASTAPLDNGSKLNNIISNIIKLVLGTYGIMIGLNLFFVMLAPIESMSQIFTQSEMDSSTSYFLRHFPFSAKILNTYVYILFMLVAFTLIESLPTLVNTLVGGQDVVATGADTKTKVGSAVKSVGDVISGKAPLEFATKALEGAADFIPGSHLIKKGWGWAKERREEKRKKRQEGIDEATNKIAESENGGEKEKESHRVGDEESPELENETTNNNEETGDQEFNGDTEDNGENNESDDGEKSNEEIEEDTVKEFENERNEAEFEEKTEEEQNGAKAGAIREFAQQNADNGGEGDESDESDEDGESESDESSNSSDGKAPSIGGIVGGLLNLGAGIAQDLGIGGGDNLTKEDVIALIRQFLGDKTEGMSDDEVQNSYGIQLSQDEVSGKLKAAVYSKHTEGEDVDVDYEKAVVEESDKFINSANAFVNNVDSNDPEFQEFFNNNADRFEGMGITSIDDVTPDVLTDAIADASKNKSIAERNLQLAENPETVIDDMEDLDEAQLAEIENRIIQNASNDELMKAYDEMSDQQKTAVDRAAAQISSGPVISFGETTETSQETADLMEAIKNMVPDLIERAILEKMKSEKAYDEDGNVKLNANGEEMTKYDEFVEMLKNDPRYEGENFDDEQVVINKLKGKIDPAILSKDFSFDTNYAAMQNRKDEYEKQNPNDLYEGMENALEVNDNPYLDREFAAGYLMQKWKSEKVVGENGKETTRYQQFIDSQFGDLSKNQRKKLTEQDIFDALNGETIKDKSFKKEFDSAMKNGVEADDQEFAAAVDIAGRNGQHMKRELEAMKMRNFAQEDQEYADIIGEQLLKKGKFDESILDEKGYSVVDDEVEGKIVVDKDGNKVKGEALSDIYLQMALTSDSQELIDAQTRINDGETIAHKNEYQLMREQLELDGGEYLTKAAQSAMQEGKIDQSTIEQKVLTDKLESGEIDASAIAEHQLESKKNRSIKDSLSKEDSLALIQRILDDKEVTLDDVKNMDLRYEKNADGEYEYRLSGNYKGKEIKSTLNDEQSAELELGVAKKTVKNNLDKAYDALSDKDKADVKHDAEKIKDTISFGSQTGPNENAYRLIDKVKDDEDFNNALILEKMRHNKDQYEMFLKRVGLTEDSSEVDKLDAIAQMKRSADDNIAKQIFESLDGTIDNDYFAVAKKKYDNGEYAGLRNWDLLTQEEKDEKIADHKRKNHILSEEEQQVELEMNVQAVKDFESTDKEAYDRAILEQFLKNGDIENKDYLITQLILELNGLKNKNSKEYAEAKSVVDQFDLKELGAKSYEEAIVAYQKWKMLNADNKDAKITEEQLKNIIGGKTNQMILDRYGLKDKDSESYSKAMAAISKFNLDELGAKSTEDALLAYQKWMILNEGNKKAKLTEDALKELIANRNSSDDNSYFASILEKKMFDGINGKQAKIASDSLMKGNGLNTPKLTTDQQDELVRAIALGDGKGKTFMVSQGLDKGAAYDAVKAETEKKKTTEAIMSGQSQNITAATIEASMIGDINKVFARLVNTGKYGEKDKMSRNTFDITDSFEKEDYSELIKEWLETEGKNLSSLSSNHEDLKVIVKDNKLLIKDDKDSLYWVENEKLQKKFMNSFVDKVGDKSASRFGDVSQELTEKLNKDYQDVLSQINEMRRKSGKKEVSEITDEDIYDLVHNEVNVGTEPIELVRLKEDIAKLNSSRNISAIADTSDMSESERNDFNYLKRIMEMQINNEGDVSQTLANLYENSDFMGKDEIEAMINQLLDSKEASSREEAISKILHERTKEENDAAVRELVNGGMSKENAEAKISAENRNIANYRNTLMSIGASDVTLALDEENLFEKQKDAISKDATLQEMLRKGGIIAPVRKEGQSEEEYKKSVEEYENKVKEFIKEPKNKKFNDRLKANIKSLIDPSKQVTDEDKQNFFNVANKENGEMDPNGASIYDIISKKGSYMKVRLRKPPKESVNYDKWNELLEKDIKAVREGKGAYANLSKDERLKKIAELRRFEIQKELPDNYYDMSPEEQKAYDKEQEDLKRQAIGTKFSEINKSQAKQSKKKVKASKTAVAEAASQIPVLSLFVSDKKKDELKSKHEADLQKAAADIDRYKSTEPMRNKKKDFGSDFETFAKGYLDDAGMKKMKQKLEKAGININSTTEADIKKKEEFFAQMLNDNYKRASGRVARDNKVNETVFLKEKGIDAGEVRYRDGSKKYAQVKSRIPFVTGMRKRAIQDYERELRENGTVSEKTQKRYDRSYYGKRSEESALRVKNEAKRLEKMHDEILDFNKNFKGKDENGKTISYSAAFKAKFGDAAYKKYKFGNLENKPVVVQQREIMKHLEQEMKKNVNRQKYSSAHIPAASLDGFKHKYEALSNKQTKVKVDHHRNLAENYSSVIKEFRAQKGSITDINSFLSTINPEIRAQIEKSMNNAKFKKMTFSDQLDYIEKFMSKKQNYYKNSATKNTFTPSDVSKFLEMTKQRGGLFRRTKMSPVVARSLDAANSEVYNNLVKAVRKAEDKVRSEEDNLKRLTKSLEELKKGIQNNETKRRTEEVQKAIQNSQIRLNNLRGLLDSEKSKKRTFEQNVATERIKESKATGSPQYIKKGDIVSKYKFPYKKPDGTVGHVAPGTPEAKQVEEIVKNFMSKNKAQFDYMMKSLIGKETIAFKEQLSAISSKLNQDFAKEYNALHEAQRKIKKELNSLKDKNEKDDRSLVDYKRKLEQFDQKIELSIQEMIVEFEKMGIHITK